MWLKIGAIASFLLFGAAGLFFILNPIDQGDVIASYVTLGAAVIVPIALLLIGNKIRSQVTIYEEGVVVETRNNEYRFHFSEIAGIRDTSSDDGVTIAGNFGLIGALVVGVAAEIASSAANAHRRKHRIRSVNIVPNNDSREISVVKTGGDELSAVYTQWVINQKSITEENIGSLNVVFGDSLEFNNGAFIHKHRRRGDTSLTLEDITRIEDIDDGSLHFYALNEKGKEKCLFTVVITAIVNLDLLFYIYELSLDDEDLNDEE